MEKVVILGAGTYGQVYAEYINESNCFEVVGYLDDDLNKIGKIYNGINVIGPIGEFEALEGIYVENIIAPIGNNSIRVDLLKKAKKKGYKTPSFIHERSNIHNNVELGEAVYILPGCNFMPFTKIADYVMVSMAVNIAHHVKIGPGCFLSQGTNIGASITLEENVFVGIGSNIMTGVKSIGFASTIGAGAVVIRDVPANAVVVGNPARVLRTNA